MFSSAAPALDVSAGRMTINLVRPPAWRETATEKVIDRMRFGGVQAVWKNAGGLESACLFTYNRYSAKPTALAATVGQ